VWKARMCARRAGGRAGGITAAAQTYAHTPTAAAHTRESRAHPQTGELTWRCMGRFARADRLHHARGASRVARITRAAQAAARPVRRPARRMRARCTRARRARAQRARAHRFRARCSPPMSLPTVVLSSRTFNSCSVRAPWAGKPRRGGAVLAQMSVSAVRGAATVCARASWCATRGWARRHRKDSVFT
jgi:hypothetical protein